MGQLGLFSISVFNDGFHVENAADGEALEISNIGSAVMLVRDTLRTGDGTPQTQTVMTDRHGHTIGWAVHLQSEASALSCTVAAFGPTANAPAIDPITAELAVTEDGLGCEPLTGEQYRGKILVLRRGVCDGSLRADHEGCHR